MVFRRVRAVRGAVCCDNAKKNIVERVIELYSACLEKNRVSEKQVISIQFTVTADLTACNPASALRSGGFASCIPLFCSAEPCIDDAPQGVIRILIYFYSKKKAVPVYLHGAQNLRPDLYAAGRMDR